MLMPLGDLHRARSFRQDPNPSFNQQPDDTVLRKKVQDLLNEVAELQLKLRKAAHVNDTLTQQLSELKTMVTAEKERRALALFKRRTKEKKETTDKLRAFLKHPEPQESDDE